jgi:hypothetical protein
MKNAMAIILMCILLIPSCSTERESTARLRVLVSQPTKRDLESFTDSDVPESYDVTVKGLFTSEGNQFEETMDCTNGAAVFSAAPIGRYEITARSYNNAKVQLGEGKRTVEIKPGENNVSVIIDKRVGTGNLLLRLLYEPEIYLAASTTMTLKVENSKGEVLYTLSDATIDKENGEILLEKRGIPSDVYLLTFQIFSHNVLCDGEVAAIDVYNGCDYQICRVYNRNPFGASPTITIDNRVSAQIRANISSVSNGGGSYTMTCNIEEYPEGTEEKDLTYAWYRNGTKIEGATGKTLTVTKTSTRYHYNCLVKGNMVGGTCTANWYI